MTVGPTQPSTPGEIPFAWEFAIRSKERGTWPRQLLYDLLTCWLMDQKKIVPGLYLPLVFFRDPAGRICTGLSERCQALNVVGDIRGLYLWEDQEGLQFSVSSGDFRLLAAVPVTADEDRLAQETTPPHLLLLLEEMGIGQVCDPHRPSVLAMREGADRWRHIKALSHDEVVRKLRGLK
jgi:hypothetical protein